MMRRTLAAIVAAGAVLAGIAAASPALAASQPINLLCSPSTNGGTLVNGVCVLPAAAVGQPYEGFLLTSNGAVDTFTITKGSLPPGLSMPATYGAAGTIVGPAPPLTITFPSACCNAGAVGSSYFQNFFTSGGAGPFTWTVAAGQLPPGVTLTGSHLGGTPTAAGTFPFTIKVTED